MNPTYTTECYSFPHECVSCRGIAFVDGAGFPGFLGDRVRERFDDVAASEEMRRHLEGLELTGMGRESLEVVLGAGVPEGRGWAAGEALAEAVLCEAHGVVFPWNMERDKRNPMGSLPGADLVGFLPEGGEEGFRFVFGEVKSSSERRCPPQVVSGREGHLGGQIMELAENHAAICQLIKWLFPRVSETEHETEFNRACERYFNSGNRDAALFGVLVRDTAPDERDLMARTRALRDTLCLPTTCDLLALYLPWPLGELPGRIREGGGAS